MKKLILFIGLLLFAFLNVCAQKEYQIEQVSAINMGDGRILFRDLKTDKPLDGEHRIIDGYHSAYILADFKEGLYNGKYEEHEYNKLICEGAYKEGRKNGVFKMYSDEGRLKEEKSYKDGKLDGAHKTYYTTGKVERERNYRMGKQDHRISRIEKLREVMRILGIAELPDIFPDELHNLLRAGKIAMRDRVGRHAL